MQRSYEIVGRVVKASGNIVVAQMPYTGKGLSCYIQTSTKTITGLIIMFDRDLASIATLDTCEDISYGDLVVAIDQKSFIKVGPESLGQIVDSQGDRLQGRRLGVYRLKRTRDNPTRALQRINIDKIFYTGITAIDFSLKLGVGQKIGLFAPAGLGKSTLLGEIVRNSSCDMAVIALIGERGREVKEFIEEKIGHEGMKKTVVVVETTDSTPLRRVMAAETATAFAEYYRSLGKDVLLVVDSLTRSARAIRDLTISSGEIPVRGGYTSSVYTELPKLIERSGRDKRGSITAIYTVLSEDNEDLDPLANELKSLFDGHIIMSRDAQNEGYKPAIDQVQSVSRLLTKLCTNEELLTINNVKKIIYRLRKERDIMLFGGTPDAKLEKYLQSEDKLISLLSQNIGEKHNSKEQSEKLALFIKEVDN